MIVAILIGTGGVAGILLAWCYAKCFELIYSDSPEVEDSSAEIQCLSFNQHMPVNRISGTIANRWSDGGSDWRKKKSA